MKIQGKQLADTLRDEDTPFSAIYAEHLIDGALTFKAKNISGGNIGAVVPVAITGVSGEVPTIVKAQATTSAMPAFGLTTASVNNNAEVQVVTFGNLTGIDTSAYAVGSTLYISDTEGELVTTPPSGSGSKIQNIGRVVRSHPDSGIIKVGGAGRTNATPNLDAGEFFLGDTNNRSVVSPYTLPTADGATGQVLTTDGAGAVTFADVAGGETFTDVTADIAATDFEAVNYRIDPANTAGITINLPTVRYNETQALALDGESFTLNNMSSYDLTLRIADAYQYNGTYYQQSYIRHSGQYDENGIGTGEPITYILRPFSSVRIHINTLLTSNIKRVIYNVIASGGILGGYHHSSQTSSFTAQLNNVYMCKPSSGDITATLPNINNVGDGERIQFKNTHSSGVVYIDPLGTQKIENSSTALMLTSLQSATIVKSGTSWYVVE